MRRSQICCALCRLIQGNLDLEYKLSLIHVSIGVAHEALGHADSQLDSFKTALAIRKQLVDTNPDNTEWKRALSWAHFWIGDYYLDEGNVDEALKNIRECMSLRLSLVKANPGDLVAKYDLAWAYHSLGMAFQRKGDLAAAAANFEEALKLRRELVEMDEKNTRWRKDPSPLSRCPSAILPMRRRTQPRQPINTKPPL